MVDHRTVVDVEDIDHVADFVDPIDDAVFDGQAPVARRRTRSWRVAAISAPGSPQPMAAMLSWIRALEGRQLENASKLYCLHHFLQGRPNARKT